MTLIIFDILLVFLLGGFCSGAGSSGGISNNWILLDEFHVHYSKDFEENFNGESSFEGIDSEF